MKQLPMFTDSATEIVRRGIKLVAGDLKIELRVLFAQRRKQQLLEIFGNEPPEYLIPHRPATGD